MIMSWILEGKRVKANYLGVATVTGTVTNSRVAYGGRVKHTVLLDQGFHAMSGISYLAGDPVLVYEDEILEHLS
jgi:hypothetical protein